MLFTRRNLVQLAGAAIAPWSVIRAFAASDFWNTKDPDSWTTDEIAKLLKKSPWAKEIEGMRPPSGGRGSRTASPLPRSTKTRNPMGMPTDPTPPRGTLYKGTVVWESAKVIRDADKTPLPDSFDGQYVLSVTGIPLAKTSSRTSLDALRQVTFLTVKGKDPLEAGTIQQNKGNGAIYYAGFSKQALAIGRDDKEVVFATAMGKVHFSAKFNPKEMLYHGELAV